MLLTRGRAFWQTCPFSDCQNGRRHWCPPIWEQPAGLRREGCHQSLPDLLTLCTYLKRWSRGPMLLHPRGTIHLGLLQGGQGKSRVQGCPRHLESISGICRIQRARLSHSDAPWTYSLTVWGAGESACGPEQHDFSTMLTARSARLVSDAPVDAILANACLHWWCLRFSMFARAWCRHQHVETGERTRSQRAARMETK